MTTNSRLFGDGVAGKEHESVLYIVVCSQIIPRTLVYFDELADALLN